MELTKQQWVKTSIKMTGYIYKPETELLDQIVNHLDNGETLKACRVLCESFDTGLLKAKDICDSYYLIMGDR